MITLYVVIEMLVENVSLREIRTLWLGVKSFIELPA